jgi:hypothetical protein
MCFEVFLREWRQAFPAETMAAVLDNSGAHTSHYYILGLPRQVQESPFFFGRCNSEELLPFRSSCPSFQISWDRTGIILHPKIGVRINKTDIPHYPKDM